jgi:hypothetical protein
LANEQLNAISGTGPATSPTQLKEVLYTAAVIVLAALATVNLIRLRTHDHARAEGPAQSRQLQ